MPEDRVSVVKAVMDPIMVIEVVVVVIETIVVVETIVVIEANVVITRPEVIGPTEMASVMARSGVGGIVIAVPETVMAPTAGVTAVIARVAPTMPAVPAPVPVPAVCHR